MKRFLWFVFPMIAIGSSVFAQTQIGYIKTRGRLDSEGALIPGERLADASVTVRGRNSVNSDRNGAFRIQLSGPTYYLQSVQKQGYVLSDPDVLSRQYAYSKDPMVLVMETPGSQTDDRLAAERKIRRTLQRQLQKKEDDLERLKEERRLSDEEYRQRLRNLFDEQDENEQLISDMAERYSRIDYDQLDEFNRRVSALILDGRLTEADSLIQTRGTMEARLRLLRQHQSGIATEEAEIARYKGEVYRRKEMVAYSRDDLAQDCFNLSEICKLQHTFDSAAYYLALRVSLDTTNVAWKREIGHFLLDYQSRFEEALAYYEGALKTVLETKGENDQMVAVLHDDIGTVLQEMGEYQQARKHYELSLSILDKQVIPDVQTKSEIVLDLCSLDMELGENIVALSLAQELLTAVSEQTDLDQSIIANTLTAIGILYGYLGEDRKNLEYQQAAMAIWLRQYGENTPRVATAYSNLGIGYCNVDGGYEQGMEYLNKALAIRIGIFGEEHPKVANVYNNIGFASANHRDLEGALAAHLKALAIKQAIYGDVHPSVALTYNNLGSTYFGLQDYECALEYHRKALDIRKRVLEPESYNIGVSLYNAGTTLEKLGRISEARSYVAEALHIFEKTLPAQHSLISTAQKKLDTLTAGD